MYIVIEGISGSGKSTFAKGLSSAFESLLIPEYIIPSSYLKENPWDCNFPMINDYFKSYLAKMSKRPNIIADRNYLSSLAFAYARQNINKENGIYDYVYNWYIASRENEKIHPPNLYVFLDIPLDVAQERALFRERPKFYRSEFLTAMRDYYLNFFKKEEKEVRHIIIDANQPLAKMTIEVVNTIRIHK